MWCAGASEHLLAMTGWHDPTNSCFDTDNQIVHDYIYECFFVSVEEVVDHIPTLVGSAVLA